MPTEYKLATKKPQLLILIFLIAYPAIGALMFTPALPLIIKEFQISDGVGQLTMILFLVGYAVGQLLYGPIANRYGRKIAIYLGVALAIIGEIFTILSGFFHFFPLLLIGRLITALGSSVGLALTFTIINDFYYQDQARRVVPYVVLSFAVLPFIAMMVAGFLVKFFGWESPFYFFLFYTFLIYFLCRKLPETSLHLDPLALKISHIKKRYRHTFTDRRLLLYAILMGHVAAILYLVAATAPLIMINELGISSALYGVVSLIISVGYVLGNIIAAELASFFSSRGVMRIGFGIVAVATFPFILTFLNGVINLYTFYLPFFFVYLGLPLIFSNAATLALADFHDRSTASATMSFINMAHAVVAVFLISLFEGHESKSLPISLAIVCLSMFFFFFLTNRLSPDLKGKR
ncbi:MAG: MFS transporter [Simkania negevensis]|nr:MFS transporter [Simkania negevensis]